MTVNVHKT